MAAKQGGKSPSNVGVAVEGDSSKEKAGGRVAEETRTETTQLAVAGGGRAGKKRRQNEWYLMDELKAAQGRRRR